MIPGARSLPLGGMLMPGHTLRVNAFAIAKALKIGRASVYRALAD
jgi:hypothetical protein